MPKKVVPYDAYICVCDECGIESERRGVAKEQTDGWPGPLADGWTQTSDDRFAKTFCPDHSASAHG